MYDNHQHSIDKFCAHSIADSKGNISFVNEFFCALSGYDSGELIGQNYSRLKSGLHTPEFFVDLWQTIDKGQVWRGEICNLTKQGAAFWVDTIIVPQKSEKGTVERFATYQIPINEARLKSVSSQIPSHIFEHLVQSNKDLAYVLDADGTFLFVNAAMTDILGYHANELLGQKITEFIHPDELVHFKSQVLDQMHDSQRATVECRFHLKNGGWWWAETTARPDLSTATPAHSIYAFSRDISERKRSQQHLSDSNELYHSLVNNLPVSLWRKDSKGRVTFVNKALLKNMKLSEDEIIGRTSYDLYPKELADKYTQDDNKVMANAEPLEVIEENIDLKTGAKLYYESIKIPIRGTDGKIEGIQGVFWDITEAIEAKERLKHQNERLTEIAWLHSHKIRGPVATIMGLINIFDWANVNSPENIEIIKKIDEVSKQLDGIIHNVVKKTGALYNETIE